MSSIFCIIASAVTYQGHHFIAQCGYYNLACLTFAYMLSMIIDNFNISVKGLYTITERLVDGICTDTSFGVSILQEYLAASTFAENVPYLFYLVIKSCLRG